VFIVAHLITGVIFEARQMMLLGFVLIPAAMFWLFADEIAQVPAD
jgi:hypothetical protein